MASGGGSGGSGSGSGSANTGGESSQVSSIKELEDTPQESPSIRDAIDAFNAEIEQAKDLGSADKNLNTNIEKSAEEVVKEDHSKQEEKVKAKSNSGGGAEK